MQVVLNLVNLECSGHIVVEVRDMDNEPLVKLIGAFIPHPVACNCSHPQYKWRLDGYGFVRAPPSSSIKVPCVKVAHVW